jgi:hypothetical protein
MGTSSKTPMSSKWGRNCEFHSDSKWPFYFWRSGQSPLPECRTKENLKGEGMKRKLVGLLITLMVGSVMFIACASDKGPAEQAIKLAEEAVNATKAEAAKYVPDHLKSLEGTLAAVKDKFTKKEYKAAITEAQSLAGKAKEVLEAAKAKKEELTKAWTGLSEGLPKMVEAIQGRVDILSKAKKLPANLTAEKLAEAKSGLATAKEEWAKALESFKAGNVTDAVSVANSVKGKAVQAMEILGLPIPEGAKS